MPHGHHLTIAPQAVVLDGREYPLDPPLEAREFAPEWTLLWLAANSHPPVPLARETVTEEWLKDWGRRLFARVIPAEAAQSLSADLLPIAVAFKEPPPVPDAFLEVEIAGSPIRIPALSLADLPWELLHDGRDWLARTRGLLRVVDASGSLPRFSPPEKRLRVLVGMASPILDELVPSDSPTQPHILDLEEQAGPFRALQGEQAPIHLRLHLHITRDTLRDELSRGCDVFHFLGHGNVGSLALEDRYGCLDGVTGEWLRERLSGNPIRLGCFNPA